MIIPTNNAHLDSIIMKIKQIQIKEQPEFIHNVKVMENKKIKEINISCDCGWDTGKEKKIICKKGWLVGQQETFT